MEFQEFVEEVKNETAKKLGEQYHVEVNRILKNNSVNLSGLTIIKEETNVSPTIYLEAFYHELCQGIGMEEIVEEICKVYEENCVEEMDVAFFTEYKQAKELLFEKLINYEANKELLEHVPYERFLDLAIVPYCLVKSNTVGTASILVRDSHVKLWETTNEEVLKTAKKNTRKRMKPEFTVLKELVKDLCCEELESDVENDEIEMYVLSNKDKRNGAIHMVYDDEILTFSKEKNCDFYILPSSVHEVILVPTKDDSELNRMSEMVKDVNLTQVDQEEILSNHAYYFRRNGGYYLDSVL